MAQSAEQIVVTGGGPLNGTVRVTIFVLLAAVGSPFPPRHAVQGVSHTMREPRGKRLRK